MATPFYQDPPQLTNTYTRDTALKSHLTRLLDPATLEAITPELETMGEQAAGPMIALARQAETHPPTLTQYGPYGRRIDHIELSHGWKEISRIAAAADGMHTERDIEHDFNALPVKRIRGNGFRQKFGLAARGVFIRVGQHHPELVAAEPSDNV